MLFVSIFALIAFASIAYAEGTYIDEYTKYTDNLYEGEDITSSFEELDTLIFTYYGTNYSIRVLSIYSNSATVRVEMKAFDLEVGESKDFDLDNDDIWDLNITLSYADSDEALLKLVLNKIEEEEPEENITNTTNSTSTDSNSTNTTNTSSQNQDNNSNHNNNNDESQNTTATSNSNGQNTDTESANDNSKKTPEVTGDIVYNVYNIDISIPPGSGIGVLVIIAIVLGGLFAYKKVKKRVGTEDEEIEGTVREKRVKKSPKITQKEPIKAADMKKAFKKFMKKTGKTITKGRKKFAELIAGDEFTRKPRV